MTQLRSRVWLCRALLTGISGALEEALGWVGAASLCFLFAIRWGSMCFLFSACCTKYHPPHQHHHPRKISSAKKILSLHGFQRNKWHYNKHNSYFCSTGCLLQDYEVFQIMENYMSRVIAFCHPLGIPVPVIHHHLDTKIAHKSTSG